MRVIILISFLMLSACAAQKAPVAKESMMTVKVSCVKRPLCIREIEKTCNSSKYTILAEAVLDNRETKTTVEGQGALLLSDSKICITAECVRPAGRQLLGIGAFATGH